MISVTRYSREDGMVAGMYTVTVEFEASRAWKGSDHETMYLTTARDDGACGIGSREGDQYLVYSLNGVTGSAPKVPLCGIIRRSVAKLEHLHRNSDTLSQKYRKCFELFIPGWALDFWPSLAIPTLSQGALEGGGTHMQLSEGCTGFVTAGHCTVDSGWNGGVEGTEIYQPNDTFSSNLVGEESVDPTFTPQLTTE